MIVGIDLSFTFLIGKIKKLETFPKLNIYIYKYIKYWSMNQMFGMFSRFAKPTHLAGIFPDTLIFVFGGRGCLFDMLSVLGNQSLFYLSKVKILSSPSYQSIHV